MEGGSKEGRETEKETGKERENTGAKNHFKFYSPASYCYLPFPKWAAPGASMYTHECVGHDGYLKRGRKGKWNRSTTSHIILKNTQNRIYQVGSCLITVSDYCIETQRNECSFTHKSNYQMLMPLKHYDFTKGRQ